VEVVEEGGIEDSSWGPPTYSKRSLICPCKWGGRWGRGWQVEPICVLILISMYCNFNLFVL
jgi:hypothetical protein